MALSGVDHGGTGPAPHGPGLCSRHGGTPGERQERLLRRRTFTSVLKRKYDNFIVTEIEPAQVVCYSGKQAEWRSDSFLRQDSTGTYYGEVSNRGGRFYLQPGGKAGIKNRIVVALRRNDTTTFASLMIAAGVNAKALQTFMGHANVSITLDRYGHLMPGSEAEAAGLLDTYLAAQRERQEEAARGAGGVARVA